MKIIEVEKFEPINICNKIELKQWKDFKDLTEKWFDEINNEWKKDEDRIIFFDGKSYFMILGDNVFFIKASRKK